MASEPNDTDRAEIQALNEWAYATVLAVENLAQIVRRWDPPGDEDLKIVNRCWRRARERDLSSSYWVSPSGGAPPFWKQVASEKRAHDLLTRWQPGLAATHEAPVEAFGIHDVDYHSLVFQLTQWVFRAVDLAAGGEITLENLPAVREAAWLRDPESEREGCGPLTLRGLRLLDVRLYHEALCAWRAVAAPGQRTLAESESVRANEIRIFPGGRLEREEIRQYVIRIHENVDPNKSMGDIAREITDETIGDSPKADALQARARKLRADGKAIF